MYPAHAQTFFLHLVLQICNHPASQQTCFFHFVTSGSFKGTDSIAYVGFILYEDNKKELLSDMPSMAELRKKDKAMFC